MPETIKDNLFDSLPKEEQELVLLARDKTLSDSTFCDRLADLLCDRIKSGECLDIRDMSGKAKVEHCVHHLILGLISSDILREELKEFLK